MDARAVVTARAKFFIRITRVFRNAGYFESVTMIKSHNIHRNAKSQQGAMSAHVRLFFIAFCLALLGMATLIVQDTHA